MMTISPAFTSRRNVPCTASIAQLSEAKIYPCLVLPIQRGRYPCGSRTPISISPVKITKEYAPSKHRQVFLIRSSRFFSFDRPNTCSMISESVVVSNTAP